MSAITAKFEGEVIRVFPSFVISVHDDMTGAGRCEYDGGWWSEVFPSCDGDETPSQLARLVQAGLVFRLFSHRHTPLRRR